MSGLRTLANACIQAVNEDVPADYYASTGYSTNAAGKRAPVYAAVVAGLSVQIQAASAGQLKHIEQLNMQNVYRNVRLQGNAQGVVRPDAKGGDLLRFPQIPGGTVQTWLVVAVLETWPDWCSLIVALQTDTAAPA